MAKCSAVVMLLFMYRCSHCLLGLLGFCFKSLKLCYAVICVLYSFAIIPLGDRGLVTLLLWHYECHVSNVVLSFFPTNQGY